MLLSKNVSFATAKSPVVSARSPLVAPRARVCKQRQAFKADRRSLVLVRAAAADGPASKPVKVALADLVAGQEYQGKVVDVKEAFALVDIGAERAGLLHISQMVDMPRGSKVTEVLTTGQTVTVRVQRVVDDKIALTTKSARDAAAPRAARSRAPPAESEEDEGAAAAEDEGEVPEVEDGFQNITVAEEPGIVFTFAEDDPSITLQSVAEMEALTADEVDREVLSEFPVPLGEFITGKVSRIEEYGVFLEFEYNGKSRTALLERDEAKVPSSKLSSEELAEFTEELEEGEELPEYVDLNIEEDIGKYYEPGMEVSAFLLDYNDKGQMSLTQWADWEVEAAAMDTEEGLMALLEQEEDIDLLAFDPEDILEADDEAEQSTTASNPQGEPEFDARPSGSSDDDIAAEYTLSAPMSRPFLKGDMLSFPSRPLGKIDLATLNTLRDVRDVDFDGDQIELQDFWQEAIPVPKNALKRLGLKLIYNEAGEPSVIQKEGKKARSYDLARAFEGSRSARVKAFVEDLMAADEEEAELPSRALRRPVVLAAAVQAISASTVKELRTKTGAGMMDCKKALGECEGDMEKAMEWLRKKGLAGADKKSGRVAAEGVIARYIHPGSRLGVLLEVNCETDFVAASDKFQSLVGELGMIIASCPEVSVVSATDVSPEMLAREREVEMGKEDLKSKPEAVRSKIVEGRLQKIQDNMALLNQPSLTDPNKKVGELIKESIAAIGENIQVRRFVRYNLGEGLEKKANDFAAEVAQQTQAKAAAPAPAAPAPPKEEKKDEPAKPVVQVSATVVKQLRDKTGAGMMDCKKALGECEGDMEAAVDWLRKKGLSGADKKAGRLAAEGVIAAYIHPGSRLGVLLEVNCETDFVAASDKFNQLVNAIAMQVAASPTVQYVTAEDIPAEVYAREKEIEMGREDLKSKPDAIRAKIAEGRVAKLAQEMALLPQPFLMDSSKTVEQAVKEAVAAIGEKISVRRFVKYQLGEGIEKKESNLAAEVAAATGMQA